MWLLACMHQYVLMQSRLVSERLATMITLMRLLPSVDEHVCGEMISLRKGLTADFAFVWRLACVHQLVPAQNRSISERLATNITLIWLHSRV